MNKIQMEDTARTIISIGEEILDNIENTDYAEVRELLGKIRFWCNVLSEELGK